MKKLLVSSLLVVSSLSAFAEVGSNPSYVANAEKKSIFTQALKASLSGSSKKVSVQCKDIITVFTGGTIGSSTAGVCKINGEIKMVCLNDNAGTVTVANIKKDSAITMESELRIMMDEQCGG